jgi:hypothetical protein
MSVNGYFYNLNYSDLKLNLVTNGSNIKQTW